MEGGRPVQILHQMKDGAFELDEKALATILLAENVRSKLVVVVSVAGASRTGKSFLMGFFLRYLRNGGQKGWLGDPSAPLTGFKWTGGGEVVTRGIWIWSEVFLVTTPQQEQVAVVLMDTQGAFDCQSTTKDCATIFALSTLISSVQVYNLSSNIQENYLQCLGYFTEYGRLAQEAQQGTTAKPFQKLFFLVRDWSYPYQHKYGAHGGRALLQKRLDIPQNMPEELKILRQRIRLCFSVTDCFLLPYPGGEVATKEDFDGRLSHIAEEFKKQIEELAPLLLAADKLLVKAVNGQKISCKQLLEYFKKYADTVKSGQLPEPKSTLAASAEVYYLQAIDKGKDAYKSTMEQYFARDGRWMKPEELQNRHDQVRGATVKEFRKIRTWGGDLYKGQYLEQLEEGIDTSLGPFIERNDRKARIRTTVMLSAIAVATFISTGGFIGIGMVGGSLACGGLASATTVGAALRNNVPSSGHWRKFFTLMDTPVNYVWDGVARVLRGEYSPYLQLETAGDEQRQPLLPKQKECKGD